MQVHADGRTRDPGGSPFACESGCVRPRERRAVGARPTGKRSEGWTWRLLGYESKSAGALAGHSIGKHVRDLGAGGGVASAFLPKMA